MTPAKCFFFDLPIELRYEIYGLALNHTIWSPRWDIKPTLKQYNRVKSRHKPNSFRDIFEEDHNPNPSCFDSLLLVNKQISIEVRDYAVKSCKWVFRSPKSYYSTTGSFMRQPYCKASEINIVPRIRNLTIEISLASDHLLIMEYMQNYIYQKHLEEEIQRLGLSPAPVAAVHRETMRGKGKADLAQIWDLTKFRPSRLEFKVGYGHMLHTRLSSPEVKTAITKERFLSILRDCFPVKLAPGGTASYQLQGMPQLG